LASISVPPRNKLSIAASTGRHSQASSSSSSIKASKKDLGRRYSPIDEDSEVESRHVIQKQQVLNDFKRAVKEIHDGFQVLHEKVFSFFFNFSNFK